MRPAATLFSNQLVKLGSTSSSAHPRPFSSSFRRHAQFSFDTASFVTRLEQEGLSRKQSVGIMEALDEVVEESIRTMTANLVTRAEQEKHQYTQKVDFAKLKSEITLLEKQDFSLLKAENERLLSEVERLKQRLREEVTRSQAGVRLDLNLEKGRIRDELAAREVKIKEAGRSRLYSRLGKYTADGIPRMHRHPDRG